MITTSVLDEVIGSITPESVPPQYIRMARVIDTQGVERILSGKEMEDFLLSPDRSEIAEARVMLDMRKIRLAIMVEVNTFFTGLNRRLLDLDDAEAGTP